jgi:hypothetical protein
MPVLQAAPRETVMHRPCGASRRRRIFEMAASLGWPGEMPRDLYFMTQPGVEALKEALAFVERECTMWIVMLDDDYTEIGEEDEPVASDMALEWAEIYCPSFLDTCHDGRFNVFFRFTEEEDSRQFAAAWSAVR